MYGKMKEHLSKTLAEIKEAGLYKEERLIESAQQAAITVKGKEVLNFCANNYLGLSNHPRLIAAAQKIMERRGYGMSSVRFICGTQDIHKELEAAISDYFKTEDTILYAACFDANGGVSPMSYHRGFSCKFSKDTGNSAYPSANRARGSWSMLLIVTISIPLGFLIERPR